MALAPHPVRHGLGGGLWDVFFFSASFQTTLYMSGTCHEEFKSKHIRLHLTKMCLFIRLDIPWQLLTDMMTSSNENIFRVTGPLCGEFTGPGEFPTQRPVTRSFDVFIDLRLNKRLSKQPWGLWFETPSWSLWGQCNRDEVQFLVRLGIPDRHQPAYIIILVADALAPSHQ